MLSFEEQRILNLGQALDALMTADIHSRGIIKPIYDNMFERVGEPLSTNAAKKLLNAMLRPNPIVLIGTGFLVKPTFRPETDGPISSALLARAISLLGGIPIIVSEQNSMDVLKAACTEAELIVTNTIEDAIERPHSVALVIMPPAKQEEETRKVIEQLLSLSPVGMVSIEHPGKADDGKYYSLLGYELKDWPGAIDDLMERVSEQGGCTIGIGDGGNEAGMGYCKPELDEIVPYGAVIGTTGSCDAPIIASISEYGAYALIAALEFVSGKKVLQSPDLEERVLRAAIRAGSVCGCSGRPTAAIDMIDVEYIRSYVNMLQCVVTSTVKFSPTRPFFIDFCRGAEVGEPGTYSGGHGK
ncbi:glutamate cyclase domain-containing protein [Hespellia stercorisuis]|uniref:D-glutamate cyclase-like C-terminal domain-containing protein n=1 Tax=Hespellia stercorisuis DSM 15480 TaxID=1121950 RepID=A0A1M6KAT3_9FIRM|nr:glutamate cyclase domain-containing protein [Hespellia stercorisuis]SHJ56065.1 protein of unknown function [Hespellia stercorisuis DSM 15480]